MATIRIPESAAPLLPFCRPWTDGQENACFSTYADLVIFSAGYGFHLHGKSAPPRCPAFVASPNPIDLSVFKSQQMLPMILLIGLGVSNTYQIARDEDRLTQLVEDYANLGCLALVKKLKASTPQSFHLDLAHLLSDAVSTDQI